MLFSSQIDDVRITRPHFKNVSLKLRKLLGFGKILKLVGSRGSGIGPMLMCEEHRILYHSQFKWLYVNVFDVDSPAMVNCDYQHIKRNKAKLKKLHWK